MNLYKISQSTNVGYDTYDSAVVCAPDPETARTINPGETRKGDCVWRATGCWCRSPDDVVVELIGKAVDGSEIGVVVASFNAG